MGGQDKQGFAMKQGVLTNQRVRLLMSPGDQCFRGHGRRAGGLFFQKVHQQSRSVTGWHNPEQAAHL
jgi:hypothetical protein